MARELVATVFVDGVPWVAGADVPEHIAARITNPAAWSQERQEAPRTAQGGEQARDADRPAQRPAEGRPKRPGAKSDPSQG